MWLAVTIFFFSWPGIYIAASAGRELAFSKAMKWLSSQNELLLGEL